MALSPRHTSMAAPSMGTSRFWKGSGTVAREAQRLGGQPEAMDLQLCAEVAGIGDPEPRLGLEGVLAFHVVPVHTAVQLNAKPLPAWYLLKRLNGCQVLLQASQSKSPSPGPVLIFEDAGPVLT